MSNEVIKTERSFTVNVSKLYNAWTEEAALKKWWKPAGRELESVTADLKEGGSIKYVFEPNNSDAGNLVIEGAYATVDLENKLVYTWNWMLDDTAVENGNYKLTVEFIGQSDGSKLLITQENETDREGIHPHKEGWESALNELEKYLSSKV